MVDIIYISIKHNIDDKIKKIIIDINNMRTKLSISSFSTKLNSGQDLTDMSRGVNGKFESSVIPERSSKNKMIFIPICKTLFAFVRIYIL